VTLWAPPARNLLIYELECTEEHSSCRIVDSGWVEDLQMFSTWFEWQYPQFSSCLAKWWNWLWPSPPPLPLQAQVIRSARLFWSELTVRCTSCTTRLWIRCTESCNQCHACETSCRDSRTVLPEHLKVRDCGIWMQWLAYWALFI
jgi:hypothetical protein